MINQLKYTKYIAAIAIATLCMCFTICSQNQTNRVQICDGKDTPITVLVVSENA